MELYIADTFTESLGRLTNEDQKAAKIAVTDFQLDPTLPSLSFHKIDHSRDRNFWSARVGRDIRMVVHRKENSYLLCYVAHHDKAYQWAETRKIETHPKTGAAQIVEVRETVKEVFIPKYKEVEYPKPEKPPLFSNIPDEAILRLGVPLEWMKDVKKATEDTILNIADHLPSEAAESLLELATGGHPKTPSVAVGGVMEPMLKGAMFCTVPAAISGMVNTTHESTEHLTSNPFEHPDAKRRFRLIKNIEELKMALEYPWDKWTIFLHPDQRELIEKKYGGPARVTGSAGTGKTVVALHRAVYLARTNPEARVLMTTHTEVLANALHAQLRRLISAEPRLAERLEVCSIDAIGHRLYKSRIGQVGIAAKDKVNGYLQDASAEVGGHKFSLAFIKMEWDQVVDAWQLETWEAYRDVIRLGRKTRLSEGQRQILWAIFDKARKRLGEQGLLTYSGMFTRLAQSIRESSNPPFDYAVADEAQDLGVAHLRFLAALGADKPNRLFFTGDLGQRIFQLPFSWKALGVNIQGRSFTLNVNYRTSHQIRTRVDRLLAPEVTDADGNSEERGNTVSVFNGPAPIIRICENTADEGKQVSAWVKQLRDEGVEPHELGVFVRSEAQMERAVSAIKNAGVEYKLLDENVETTGGKVSIGTMHLAKGLEFKAVVVMACDDEVIPLQSRISSIADEADLEDVYITERHLLYVACTRARDHLLITGINPASEFLEDMQDKRAGV